MSDLRPLPRHLTRSSFLRDEALSAGLTLKQLRGKRFNGPSRGIRTPAVEGMTLGQRVRAVSLITDGSAVSHVTAAKLWEFPLPWCMQSDESVHVTRPSTSTAVRRKGVIGHSAVLAPGEVVMFDGVRLTSRVKTWFDLAAELSVEDLVVIGDHLVRVPRPRFELRFEALAQISDLRDIIAEHKGKRGIAHAREAVELVRVGADSAPETRLRLALLGAGLPEPELNQPLMDDHGIAWHEPDMQYRRYKIAIEYEGDHHRTAEQLASDIRRAENTAVLGWLERRVSKADMRDGAKAAIAKVRQALLERGWGKE